ncbi:MAG: von Willebrand factor type A domain-containing protein [Candidatus Krumholzibacteriia bacterium]
MKSLFDKHAHRLSKGEQELIWRQISAGSQQERRRRRQFVTALSGAGALVAAGLILTVMMLDPNPAKRVETLSAPSTRTVTPGTDALAGRAVADAAPEALDEVAPLRSSEPVASREMKKDEAPAQPAEEAPATTQKVAAPAAQEHNPTVVSSEAGRRDAAADMGKAAREELSAAPLVAEYSAAHPQPEVEPDSTTSWVRTASVAGDVMRVYGHVVDSQTGDPLAYANVTVKGTNFGTMTKVDGSFEFTMPKGEYTVIVSSLGYDSAQLADVSLEREVLKPLTRFAMVSNSAIAYMVEGEAPEVDVKSSSEHRRKEQDLSAFAVDNVQEAMALEAGITMKGGDLYVRGGRTGEVSMQMDGVPVKDPGVALPSGVKQPEAKEEAAKTNDPRPSTLAGQTQPARDSRQDRDEEDAYVRARRLERERRQAYYRRCWWTPPDYNNPNGEPFDAMYFRDYGTNPFVVTEEDALSTFAVDVDRASYNIVRRYLDERHLPPKEAVRVEEFVNAMDPGYGRVRQGDFALHADGMPSPYRDGYQLLRLGVQAREAERGERRRANLVFVIDTSGSMAREDRLGLVKRSLGVLLDGLSADDTVGIVEYGSTGRVVLPPTSVEDRRTIERAIESLHTNGSTNAEQGLDLGYTMASRVYDAKAINRLVLCSDGVANTGETDAERILDKVRYQSDRGIYLSTVGFGMGNYNDVLMETLADKGDGNYYYVDSFDEARRLFGDTLAGTLMVLGRDAKIQVEFDPESVLRWRLLGYENRDVADEDFRNDSVDAGEIGPGHTVVALYELKLSDEAARAIGKRGSAPLGTLRLRYEHPESERDAGEVEELSKRFGTADLLDSASRADLNLRLTALAAQFAEVLRGSYWARDLRLTDLEDTARDLDRALGRDDTADPEIRDFLRSVERAARLGER